MTRHPKRELQGYTELNPLRAGLISAAEEWLWSSAGAHRGVTAGDLSLSMEFWAANWNRSSWKEYLAEKKQKKSFSHSAFGIG